MSSLEERYAPTVRFHSEEVRRREGGAAAALVRRAFRFAARHHQGETRLNGDPFLAHSVAVAQIVAERGGSSRVIAAALVHDVRWRARDIPELAHHFGDDVARLVRDLAALGVSEVALPGAHPDVLLLKLADRLHNLHTVDPLSRDVQVQKATETLRLLVPRARTAGHDELGEELFAAAHHTLTPGRSPRSVRPPFAALVLRLAALLLPAPSRGRWLGEWRAEMSVLRTRRARWRFAVDVALGCPRMALETRWAGTGEAR
ncbi:HD domain-containing protein [Actinomycetospora aeridis]|uniref:HD domain-containing protein n=1 Tax=Actinomycetospora aeridis TaxID=3129231 RepID=A0ABU8NEA9_9PSEU